MKRGKSLSWVPYVFPFPIRASSCVPEWIGKERAELSYVLFLVLFLLLDLKSRKEKKEREVTKLVPILLSLSNSESSRVPERIGKGR